MTFIEEICYGRARKFTRVVWQFLDKFKRPNADDLDWENVKGLLIREYMKRAEKNEKQ